MTTQSNLLSGDGGDELLLIKITFGTDAVSCTMMESRQISLAELTNFIN